MPARWDIFCKVVDNFGDAGICWRLARQLAREHAILPTLWLDDPAVLARIARGVDARAPSQSVDGVSVRRWTDPLPAVGSAGRRRRGVRLRPARGLRARNGRAAGAARMDRAGIPERRGLGRAHARPAVAASKAPDRAAVLVPGILPRQPGDCCASAASSLRAMPSAAIPPPAPNCGRRSEWTRLLRGDARIALFCYPNDMLPDLLDAWADGDTGIACIVPEGVAAGALDRWTGGNVPHPRHPVMRGRLALHSVPFVDQDTLRPPALVVRRELRPRRGFVRARAVGGAPVRVAHLPAGGARALGEARGVSRPVPRRRRCRRRERATPALARVERRLALRPARGRVAGIRRGTPATRPACRRLGATSREHFPISRAGWSRPRGYWYN